MTGPTSPPVITGVGVICALGSGHERVWQRLLAGETGLRPATRLDTTGLRNDLVGEVPDEDLPDADGSRYAAYAAAAIEEAVGHAVLPGLDGYEGGLVLATNFGGQDGWWAEADTPERYATLDFHSPAANALALEGPLITLSNACSSGTHALGHAADLVRPGEAEVVVACGADELGLFCLSGLSILHTITADTIRPFDVRRSGTIFGEGAAALVVESAEHAAARGAEPLAEVLGYGVNNNAYHMTAPDKGGAGMARAITAALAQAGLAPEAVAHVNAHATGTEHHDPAECEALKTVLGDHAYRLPVSALKAATGHAMGAAGAIEAVACVLALRDGLAPPTLNLEQPDPACDLAIVTGEPRPFDGDVALSVSAGLGGNNSAVLLGRPGGARR